ncbi:hypothetical protein [Streptomyces niveus]|uniref:hypothetical protein n=1 Tax=Streptomyces niveus TaxID=193462 RepID=UPI003424F7BA
MSNPTEKIDIVVGDFPTDAALYNVSGVRTLFMGKGQTFTRAVCNVRNVLPGVTIEAAERMIREQCPEFRDFDELLGRTEPVPQSVEGPPAAPAADVVKERPSRNKHRQRVVLVAALLPALAASWAMGRYMNVADTSPSTGASAPDATVEGDGAVGEAKAPFADSKFKWFSGSSDIECDPISTLEAECTDADGMVMSTKAATGPDSTIFSFSYGSERIGLRIFYDAEYADTWARQTGSKELYPHMTVHDRYILWGTDPGRIKEYADLLVEVDRDKPSTSTAMGGATPLPPRLAALTLGTLGLNDRDVNQIIAHPMAAMTDASVMVAARLVLGLDPAPPGGLHEGDDIVAIAAGIEPNPPVVVPTRPVVVPVSNPGTGTGSGPSSTTPTTPPTTPPTSPSTLPATDTKPPTESAPPSPPATPTVPATPPPTTPEPPVEEPPAPPVEQPPVEQPPVEQPPVEEPPVEEPPAPPVEQPPVEEPPVEEPPAPPVEQPPVEQPPVEEPPAPPVEQPPVEQPPVEEPPAPPVEETVPVEGQDSPTQPTGQAGDDLLILDSAWTVAAAA